MTYPNLRITPSQAADSLRQLRSHFFASHIFYADDVSLLDQDHFQIAVLTGSKQVMDTYLAGGAYRKGAILATLDGGLAWKAVRGGENSLIEKV